jgi:fructokinase
MQFQSTINATAICLTCGSKGVYFKTNLLSWNFIAAHNIKVKNATGAGDSFWAGFFSAYLNNVSIENAVENGIRIASLKLQNLLYYA